MVPFEAAATEYNHMCNAQPVDEEECNALWAEFESTTGWAVEAFLERKAEEDRKWLQEMDIEKAIQEMVYGS